jgi:hypothetical protein
MNAKITFQPGFRHFALMLFGAIVVVCCGCSSLMQLPSNGVASRLSEFVKGDPKKDAKRELDFDEEFDTKLETPTVGNYISVQGNTMVPLRGVGLVVNLNGTGGSPPPSPMQTKLRQEMARRNIKSPSKILASDTTALVVVTAFLPPNVRKDQPFDVRILLPMNTSATSLKGGYLLRTRLFEETEVRGSGIHKGGEYAVAEGPVLTAFGATNDETQSKGLLARGSIPGGAKSRTERGLTVVLRKKFQSFRKSKQIADAISTRFKLYDRFGRMEVQAEAKTNALIELRSHPTYRNNFPRFHQVVRHIPLSENEVARRLRMEALAESLLMPSKSAMAAVELEAIGGDAKPFLRTGLDSSHPEVRFFAAEALAYLQDAEGVDVLKAAARDEPAFRVYALAALSIMDNHKSVLALRELMSAESLEARYGAVRALSDMDDDDRGLGTLRFKKKFVMRQIDSKGKPAVHLARRRSPEVTVFNIGQKLMLPAVLNVGERIRVIGHDGDDTVQVTRYRIGEETVRRTCSSRMVDILRTAGELGAAYPDIVQFMVEAEKQDNLAGELGIDRLPQGGRTYLPQVGNSDAESESEVSRKVGTSVRIPGMFDRIEEDDSATKIEELDLTTFKLPKEPELPIGLEDKEDAAEVDATDAELDLIEADDREKSGGVLKRMLKNPFGQHSF